MEEIAKSQRKNRVVWTDAQRHTSKLALDVATLDHGMIGHAESVAAYQADGAVQLERIMGHPLPPSAKREFKAPADMTESEYPF